MPFLDKEKHRKWQRDHYWRNQEHYKAKVRAHYHAHPEKTRDYLLRKKFGITLEQYQRMWKARQGLCDNCGNPQVEGRWLAIDHDHETNEIRGMLCDACNCSLGLLDENIDRIEGLARYLRFFRSRGSLSAM